VATDLPVTREVLGELATLVPDNDVGALAEALALATADPADAGRAAEQRRRHARLWTWRRCADAARVAYARALL
jgi:glycosyltransferase involved in cell wall biosynthesis